MDVELTNDQQTIRCAVAELAGKFDDHHWMTKDQDYEFSRKYHGVRIGRLARYTFSEEYGGYGHGIIESSEAARGSRHVWWRHECR